MQKITVTELARGLSDFINRATYRREEFRITRGGRVVATLAPAPTGLRVRDLAQPFDHLPPLAKGDAEAFASDLKLLRQAHDEPVEDPCG